jgi:allantoate deiminase
LLGGRPLPFGLEIVGFSEEEGVRFGVPFIGSKGWLGELAPELLATEDKRGISITEAIRRFGRNPHSQPPAEYPEPAGFLEFHIEQGPVLENLDLPLGLVTAIAGQTRASLTFQGKANHAGTTPMHLRQDALAGAAEWITAVEKVACVVDGLVATVGDIEVLPGATNVIPGEARVTLDVRHADDAIRDAGAQRLLRKAEAIASARNLQVEYSIKMNQDAVPMHPGLVDTIEHAMASLALKPHRMVSGAGHDAMIVAEKIPSAMIFLRSPGGISHHPAESVRLEDVEMALRVGWAFLERLSTEKLY